MVEPRASHLRAPPEHDPGEPQLIARARSEIEQRGRLTFARFMQLALYEPRLGYYATGAERASRAGDFLTAPELHPIFGQALANQLEEMWQRLGEPHGFVLREYGAGSGALAMAIMEALARRRSALLSHLRYQPIELAGRQQALERRLDGAGLGALVERGGARGSMVGCVVANEYVDALPVHRMICHDGRLQELYVTWREGRFVEEPGAPSRPELTRWFADAGVQLAEGQRAEVNLAMLDWLDEVGADLAHGYALVIDYGAEPAALYGPARHSGTLRAFRDQHVSSDVLAGMGHQDLTAHIDIGALERGAGANGLELVGRTTQAEFLVGCGLEELLALERDRVADEWEQLRLLRAAVGRLLDPRALGGYAVVILGRGVADHHRPPLRGLAYRIGRD